MTKNLIHPIMGIFFFLACLFNTLTEINKERIYFRLSAIFSSSTLLLIILGTSSSISTTKEYERMETLAIFVLLYNLTEATKNLSENDPTKIHPPSDA